MAGKLNRLDAAQLISKQFDIDRQKEIIPISMKCETGRTDVLASFYVYDSLEEAKEQLPRYRLLRNMSKEDRKKIIDEEKAAKLKAKQAAAAESKSASVGAGGKKK
jgi:small subunit ribosomal protein S24e